MTGRLAYPSVETGRVLAEVSAERIRQHRQLGTQTPTVWSIVARGEMESFVEDDPENPRERLVELVAMLVGWIEAIDRGPRHEPR